MHREPASTNHWGWARTKPCIGTIPTIVGQMPRRLPIFTPHKFIATTGKFIQTHQWLIPVPCNWRWVGGIPIIGTTQAIVGQMPRRLPIFTPREFIATTGKFIQTHQCLIPVPRNWRWVGRIPIIGTTPTIGSARTKPIIGTIPTYRVGTHKTTHRIP